MIEISNASVRAGGRLLVDGVSLSVASGEVVALAGPNGAGKSTLLKTLTRERPLCGGRILIDGHAVESWPDAARAKRLAVLPQHSTLQFPFTSLEVVLMGRLPHLDSAQRSNDHAIAMSALETCDVAHLVERSYPTLSGGEQQRVQLARVLAQIWEPCENQSRYLLLDEPTTSLDMRHQHAILETARTFARRNVGVLAVLHDLALTGLYADRIAFLKAGRIVALGPPEDVLTAPIVGDVFDWPVEVARIGGRDPAVVAVFPRSRG